MDVHVPRTVPITYEMVAKAYQKVKRGGKATGIDHESWQDFALKGVEKQLYVVWNRLASGSYHPQAVREVEIPKKDGEFRKLGIPTIRDRIAQEVIRAFMEQRIDQHFHENSYGYRPLKSSHEALEQVVKNCIECDWVVDLDISNFFGELDHSLLQKAVEAMIQEKWVMMYVDRWLKAKIERADGTQYSTEGKGTPQGGVISPLLANLYLHFSLDEWLRQNYPTVRFVRYADDIVVHCKSEAEAKAVMQAIQQRLSEVKLRLNETKSKIVYCKDYRRKGKHEQVQFGFLGFSFQPRAVQSKVQPGTSYMGFTAEISVENQKKIKDTVRTSVNWRDTTMELTDIAVRLNSKLRGWINYFSFRGRRHLRNTMIYVDVRLLKWLQRKHKQGPRATLRQLAAIQKLHPRLFYHWEKGYCYNVKEMTRAV
jgi:group II intron reverse transcriptase/maturase